MFPCEHTLLVGVIPPGENVIIIELLLKMANFICNFLRMIGLLHRVTQVTLNCPQSITKMVRSD